MKQKINLHQIYNIKLQLKNNNKKKSGGKKVEDITKETLNVLVEKPQYITSTHITYAQVDSWYGHCRRDLHLDITYPTNSRGKHYPCVVWICGGGWRQMDKSAHMSYLSKLTEEGFVIASVEYRTSNEGIFPVQLQDIKAAIRYLKAHHSRYCIDTEHIGVMGESAGGYLACMIALVNDSEFEVGDYLEESSAVQAVCPWYPPTNLVSLGLKEGGVASPEALLLGFDPIKDPGKAYDYSPVSRVTKKAPPFLIIHGNRDTMVSYEQSVELYEKLKENECDVKLLTIEGAEHAGIQFFQEQVWKKIIQFFKEKLS